MWYKVYQVVHDFSYPFKRWIKSNLLFAGIIRRWDLIRGLKG